MGKYMFRERRHRVRRSAGIRWSPLADRVRELDTILDPAKPICRLRPSGNTQHVARRALQPTLVIASCLAALGCTTETQPRPRSADHSAASEIIEPSRAPLPETAFTSDGIARNVAREPSSNRPDRFATRTIGSSRARDAETDLHGAPVDLDLTSADVRDVFRLLADVGKVNVVVAGEVSGTITMRPRHVPWDQAMEVIARARGLAYERDGDVILVRPAPSSTAK